MQHNSFCQYPFPRLSQFCPVLTGVRKCCSVGWRRQGLTKQSCPFGLKLVSGSLKCLLASNPQFNSSFRSPFSFCSPFKSGRIYMAGWGKGCSPPCLMSNDFVVAIMTVIAFINTHGMLAFSLKGHLRKNIALTAVFFFFNFRTLSHN